MTLPEGFKRALRHFVYYYSNGTLPFVAKDGGLLLKIDYREILKEEASQVEQIFAIYTNNIQMDEKGKVLNQNHAINRATQYILSICSEDQHYIPIPEFEDWELELH